MTTYEFEVKEKGRAVLPAGLRAACGFDVGVRLVARQIGPGQAVIETTDAVAERIWSGIPEGSTDAVEELALLRSAQLSRHQERAARPSEPEDEEASNERSAALLAALGID